MKVYVASALGFSELGRLVYKAFLKETFSSDWKVLDPWKSDEWIEATKKDLVDCSEDYHEKYINRMIAEKNKNMIQDCNVVVAILDGNDLDPGVCAEIGFAYALGKKIIGYRGDFRLCSDNKYATMNLQVEYFIRSTGGSIVHYLSELKGVLDYIA